MGSPARYSIGTTARLTGLSVETLRAWERRHRVVEPAREGRARTYGDPEVAKLRALARLVAAGHSIGRLAQLEPRRLGALLAAERGAARARPSDRSRAVDAAWRAVQRFDVDGLQSQLDQAASFLPAEALCLELALPLLRRVGEAWAKGRAGVAQEHLVSAALRTLLGSMLRLARATERPRVVFATLEGELHEFGLLAAALLAAGARLSPVYLGPSVPVADVLDAVRRTGAVAVVVAVVTERTDTDPIDGLAELARGAGSRVEVLVGGARGRRFIEGAAGVGARWVKSLEEFAAECRRMGAPR